MPIETIFYSWQSDLPNKTNRGLIEVALRRAIEALRKTGVLEEEHVIDRDTKGTPGSPDIAATIFKKIDSASIFVADISIIATSPGGRPCSNPNVLIELGYALKSLSTDTLILVYNTAFGNLADLPFDLRGKRVASYSLTPDEEPAAARQQLTVLFKGALSDIVQHQRHGVALRRNSEFATNLVYALIEIQLFGNEVSLRRVNPWLDQISSTFSGISQWLREHSHESAAVELELAEPMESLANALDEVRGHVHTVGGSAKFGSKVITATEAAAKLQSNITGKGTLSKEALSNLASNIIDLHKRLAGWVRRTRGQNLYHLDLYDDFIFAVIEIGRQLARISYYPLDHLEGGPSSQALRRVAEALHLVDLTAKTNSHKSREWVVNLVADNEADLSNMIQSLKLTY